MRASLVISLIALASACTTPREEVPVRPPGAESGGSGGAAAASPDAASVPVAEGGAPVDMGAAPAVSPDLAAPSAVDTGCAGAACLLAAGGACTTGTQCQGGQCVDGVCCNKACDGVCQTCKAPGREGTCVGMLNRNDAPGCSGADRTCLGSGTCAQIQVAQNGIFNCNATLFDGVDAVAQSFTVSRTGQLVGIRLDIGCTPMAKLWVTLHSVNGNTIGPPLSETAIAVGGDALAEQASQRVALQFRNPASVKAGDKLAFAFSVIAGMCGYPRQCAVENGSAPVDTYPAGQVWIKDLEEGILDWQLRPHDDVVFDLLLLPGVP